MQQIFSKISLHNFCAAKVKKKKKYANFLAKIFIFFEKSVFFLLRLTAQKHMHLAER